MPFWDTVGDAGSTLGQGFNGIFGDGTGPGAVGTGQYQFKGVPIDQSAGRIPGADAWQSLAAQGYQGTQGRGPASMQAAQLDGSQQGQWRGQQMGLAQALAAQANGQGPSLAQGQLRQATDQGMNQAMALGASQRGDQASTQLRGIAMNQSALQGQANADSAQMAMQEQLGARNQLGQLLAGGRGQDLAQAGQNASFQQGANQANLGASMQQRGLNDQLSQYYMSQGMDMSKAQQQAALQLQQLNANYNLGQNQVQAGAYADAAKQRSGFFSNVMGGIGSIASF